MTANMQIVPWFGGTPVVVRPLSEKVAYCWMVPQGAYPETHVQTIADLMVWHLCDHSLWENDPTKTPELVHDTDGWHPTGVGAHTLVTIEPLHIEASVYWPDCCGLHGWIRDGRWIDA